MQYRIKNTKKTGRFTIILPASKSINNRLLVISALSKGKIQLNNISESDDSQIMNSVLNSENKVKDAGHAGTVMRFLTAYYAIQPGEIILTGSERMKSRPIEKLVDALRLIGAKIEYIEKIGFPPLAITGRELSGGKICIDSGISSQYISALMMIGSSLENGIEIKLKGDTISSSYIDLTLGLLKKAGVKAQRIDKTINIKKSEFNTLKMSVEADWSSASYWFSMVGLSEELEIVLPGLDELSLQGDAEIRHIFSDLGVQSVFTNEGLILTPGKQEINSFEYDFRDNPDMVQTFIPYCIAKDIPFYFSGCQSLRIKETDRVFALATELKKFGVNLHYSRDGENISWDGKSKPDWTKPIAIDTYDDHRMALGMAPLCIMTGELQINEPAVVSKSYPNFWKDMRKAGFSITEV
ncbi:MAG: 3-phosphoshikimate 1-carboxyvinyltransferase [Bacteroidales bacterium]|nr:3-phosphoshikimate 1-carboxyvinyltransferase [Bacteroidales bacterium]MCF8391173.1 3-phosphoshikimate 1-carboxyvinyltransferase [Bacteroidales bacterium]